MPIRRRPGVMIASAAAEAIIRGRGRESADRGRAGERHGGGLTRASESVLHSSLEFACETPRLRMPCDHGRLSSNRSDPALSVVRYAPIITFGSDGSKLVTCGIRTRTPPRMLASASALPTPLRAQTGLACTVEAKARALSE